MHGYHHIDFNMDTHTIYSVTVIIWYGNTMQTCSKVAKEFVTHVELALVKGNLCLYV